MKNHYFVGMVLFIGSYAWSSTALNCSSQVIGDLGKKLNFRSEITSDSKLRSAKISGAFSSNRRDMQVNNDDKLKGQKFEGMTQFTALEDAWCWYSVILPKNASRIPERRFVGYVQRVCDQEPGMMTVPVDCRLN